MKKNILKIVALALLVCTGGRAEAGFWDGTKNLAVGTAKFTGRVGLSAVGNLAAADLSEEVIGSIVGTEKYKKDYTHALSTYGKSLAAGITALTAASLLNTNNPGIALSASQQILTVIGNSLISLPLIRAGNQMLITPLIKSMESKNYKDALYRYALSLGVGLSTLKLAQSHNTLRILLSGLGKNLISLSTILGGHGYIKNNLTEIDDLEAFKALEQSTIFFEVDFLNAMLF